jgi:hypothetical protein
MTQIIEYDRWIFQIVIQTIKFARHSRHYSGRQLTLLRTTTEAHHHPTFRSKVIGPYWVFSTGSLMVLLRRNTEAHNAASIRSKLIWPLLLEVSCYYSGVLLYLEVTVLLLYSQSHEITKLLSISKQQYLRLNKEVVS